MFQARRMFKVISPIERRDGSGHYWLRCGNAYLNKDNSINVYLDALPASGQKDGLKLQLRELTEEELRERSEKRATHPPRGQVDPNLITGGPTLVAEGGVPF